MTRPAPVSPAWLLLRRAIFQCPVEEGGAHLPRPKTVHRRVVCHAQQGGSQELDPPHPPWSVCTTEHSYDPTPLCVLNGCGFTAQDGPRLTMGGPKWADKGPMLP